MTSSTIRTFPRSRIATNDVCAIGLKKHHVVAMLEVDVTASREKIRMYRRSRGKISFMAWMISVISQSVKEHAEVAAYLKGKRRLILFDEIRVSIAVEKQLQNERVPIPLLLEKAHARSMESITAQIEDAKNQVLSGKDIVLQKKTNRLEMVYYRLPGWLRRAFWMYLLKHPRFAFRNMGNVAITSIGVSGKADGWFIPISVHPVCFGIGNIRKKPAVYEDRIAIREMLKITILMDHDVIDGMQMARFISNLTARIEDGYRLDGQDAE